MPLEDLVIKRRVQDGWGPHAGVQDRECLAPHSACFRAIIAVDDAGEPVVQTAVAAVTITPLGQGDLLDFTLGSACRQAG